jgi:hypothetical protein
MFSENQPTGILPKPIAFPEFVWLWLCSRKVRLLFFIETVSKLSLVTGIIDWKVERSPKSNLVGIEGIIQYDGA